MIEIKINPEIRKVKEKFFGLEAMQAAIVVLTLIISVLMMIFLPDFLGFFKGIIAAVIDLPLIILCLRDFYGMRGVSLIKGILRSIILSRRKITYQSDTFKGVK